MPDRIGHPLSIFRGTLWGFLIGASGPFGWGLFEFYRVQAYFASLPKLPNTGHCGMPMLVPIGLIVVVTPACGLCGSTIRIAWNVIQHFVRNTIDPEPISRFGDE